MKAGSFMRMSMRNCEERKSQLKSQRKADKEELAGWLAVLQRGRELRYCSKAGKK